ncbi:hypothetical protein K438DRAFT_2029696 [Mycena galopus ATCC 62051]|nr:hypothetical protein K438DRAFT_2029696 [Mycena galopus ATCC 62051]
MPWAHRAARYNRDATRHSPALGPRLLRPPPCRLHGKGRSGYVRTPDAPLQPIAEARLLCLPLTDNLRPAVAQGARRECARYLQTRRSPVFIVDASPLLSARRVHVHIRIRVDSRARRSKPDPYLPASRRLTAPPPCLASVPPNYSPRGQKHVGGVATGTALCTGYGASSARPLTARVDGRVGRGVCAHGADAGALDVLQRRGGGERDEVVWEGPWLPTRDAAVPVRLQQHHEFGGR